EPDPRAAKESVGGRGHWTLIGSLCAEISAPTISVQRVTNSAEAKPCRLNVSPTTLPTRSRSGLANGLANEREGLFMLRGSAMPPFMRANEGRLASRVTAKPASKQRAQRGT